MTDHKMQGAPIVKSTTCRIGLHAWQWTGSGEFASKEPPMGQRCDCGAYTWREWKESSAEVST